MNAWVLLWDRSRWNPNVLGRVGTCLGWFWFKAFWNCRGNHFAYVYAFACIMHACAGSLHMYASMFINSLRMHAGPYIRMLVLKNLIFCLVWFFFFRLFSLSNHDSYTPFHPLLQVLPPFTGRGCTRCISSWYRALTKDIKAFIHIASFKLVILLLLEGFASGILV